MCVCPWLHDNVQAPTALQQLAQKHLLGFEQHLILHGFICERVKERARPDWLALPQGVRLSKQQQAWLLRVPNLRKRDDQSAQGGLCLTCFEVQ